MSKTNTDEKWIAPIKIYESYDRIKLNKSRIGKV